MNNKATTDEELMRDVISTATSSLCLRPPPSRFHSFPNALASLSAISEGVILFAFSSSSLTTFSPSGPSSIHREAIDKEDLDESPTVVVAFHKQQNAGKNSMRQYFRDLTDIAVQLIPGPAVSSLDIYATKAPFERYVLPVHIPQSNAATSRLGPSPSSHHALEHARPEYGTQPRTLTIAPSTGLTPPVSESVGARRRCFNLSIAPLEPSPSSPYAVELTRPRTRRRAPTKRGTLRSNTLSKVVYSFVPFRLSELKEVL
ncbi:hypothetical protein B0H19DRAFT_1274618 [Mycena capillaripes]|nr:hypothetical protein B0H19DRAFT_1274618 [Mycena capillaripes]